MAGKSYLKTALIIFVFFVVLTLAGTAHPKTIYVDEDSPADFDNIQAAIDNSNDGDIIIVNPGTYIGYGNRDIEFKGKVITVRSTDPNDPNIVAATVIDCEGSDEDNHRGFYFRSGEDENSILEGLTITNGFHTTGAGICCRASSPTIRNNVITGNEIGYDWDGGAGIGCWYGASPTITNNIISNNTCAPGGGGGGIRCYEAGSLIITNNTISGNSASQGGGILIDDCNPLINNCIIADNSTVYQGGGILISMTYSENSPKIYNSTFTCNSATAGSGIYIANWGNDEFSPILTNCIFTHNSAIYKGGGMYCMYSSPILTNCIFNGNSAGDYGGGVYNYGYCSYAPCHRYNGPTLKNCTFYGNLGIDGSALACDSHNQCYPSNIQITNCILSDGGNEILIGDSSHIMATYSNIHGGWPGEGNMDVDPLFHDPDGVDDIPGTEDDNLRLSTGSPCIDAGDPNYIAGPNETDLDGRQRVFDGDNDGVAVVDMGAYECRFTISAEARIVPRSINLASKGKWITCYIWLPEQYNVTDIKTDTILLECEIKLDSLHVDEQEQVATAIFSREDVLSILEVGEIKLKITGRLTDSTYFEAADTVKVINKAGKN
ncbi:MAG: hypothetical protein GWN67_09725 [Phycisphaerae bacterium]|nr:hypothetical protein [Phycisphaerae bacterium]NIP50822.1 hypothetical protein [Phycisphaerae bacterium]NIS51360.1 hypothetical protein [Phycisphaerae bacterium]NIU08972.1 hypothetical protein [Phycisphaerae bacterium]NIU56641.1 hypothetical protein [Phycisphaerae bacterium]